MWCRSSDWSPPTVRCGSHDSFGNHGTDRRTAARNTDRKSTRLNSSHEWMSYAVFCLKKKKKLLDGINVMKYDYKAVSRETKFIASLYAAMPDPTPSLNLDDTLRAFLHSCFFFNDPATTEIYTLPLHDALPI